MSDFTIRPATHDDYDDITAFTEDSWDGGDYLPDIYHDWLEGEDKQTLVADADDEIAGIGQMVFLSDWEAWGQGLRVNPMFRGQDVGIQLSYELSDWAREKGAIVARAWVYSWNQAGLGTARAAGGQPISQFRWLKPEPDPALTDANQAPEGAPATVEPDPNRAWAYWTDSDARQHLGGLGISLDVSWALQEVTREMLARAADETALLVIGSDDGTEAVSYRARTFERDTEDGETETCAEYGVASWDNLAAARALRDAIAADAASVDADQTRVLIPETAEYVSDGAVIRANISDEPDFVLATDLTGGYRTQ